MKLVNIIYMTMALQFMLIGSGVYASSIPPSDASGHQELLAEEDDFDGLSAQLEQNGIVGKDAYLFDLRAVAIALGTKYSIAKTHAENLIDSVRRYFA